jgi:hypothetical protein
MRRFRCQGFARPICRVCRGHQKGTIIVRPSLLLPPCNPPPAHARPIMYRPTECFTDEGFRFGRRSHGSPASLLPKALMPSWCRRPIMHLMVFRSHLCNLLGYSSTAYLSAAARVRAMPTPVARSTAHHPGMPSGRISADLRAACASPVRATRVARPLTPQPTGARGGRHPPDPPASPGPKHVRASLTLVGSEADLAHDT